MKKILSSNLAAVAALLMLATPAAHAAARTWSGGSGDWQTGVQGGWNGVWANGDTGTFNGPGGTVTNKSAIATGNAALAFTAGNYTLQSDGATLRTITVSNSNVTLGNGVTTTIGTNVTLARSAGANTLIFDGNSTATSTLNINSGGKAVNGSAAFTIREATANVNAGGTIESGGSLVLGDTADGATLNVLGGTVTLGTGSLGAVFGLGNTAPDSPTVNFKITGGSLGFADAVPGSQHFLRVGPTTPGAGVVTATIDLEGGTVAVRRIFESSATYSSTLNLHGGTLKALADEGNYIAVDNIWIKSGGVTFDSNGKAITVTRDLLTDVVSTGGGLTLNDSAATKGTLTLAGVLTYTGPTLVSAGKLVVPSTHSGTGAATVSANATLGVAVSGTSQWQPASLTLANPCTLEFNNVQNPGTTTAPLLPTAAVGPVTNVTININSIPGAVAGNSYPLLGNQGGTTNGYTLGTQPPGVTGSLAVNGTTLVYTVSSVADIWAGTDGPNPTWWDIATTVNWAGKALGNPSPGTYVDGDEVLFDDTAAPASPVTVEIQTAVAPGDMVFNSSKNYTVNGPSGIGGTGTLTKTGSGTLTLGTDNGYSGATTVNQGTLSITHSNALGSTAGATTISPTISGNASLVLNDATADLAVAEKLNFISTSTLRARLENTSAFNHTLSGNIIVDSSAAGAITEFRGDIAGSIIINGDITGAIGTGSSFLIRGNTVGVGGVINGNITLTGGGLSKADNGIWTIGAPGKTYMAPIINVNQGILKLGADNYLASSTVLNSGNITSGGGTFDLNGFSQTVAGLTTGNPTGAKIITSSSGNPVLTVNNIADYAPHATLTLEGSLSLTKQGAGKLTLSGANTFTGATIISAGTLLVNGSLAGGAVQVNSGTLGGSGTIYGPVTVNSGGTLAAGASIGTLTLGGAATNNGTIVMEITNGPSADKIVFSGSVHNLGGTLTVTNLGTLVNGTTYDLFDFNSMPTGVAFSTVNLPGGPSHWNTTDLFVGGTITFANNAPVAASFTSGVAIGGTIIIEVLGKFVSDADVGDTVTIAGFTPASNGTVSIQNGTNLVYTSTNTAAGDSFTYTVSDGLTTATGTVTVQTYSPVGFNKLSGPVANGGAWDFSYLGIPGQKYALDESAQLVPPYTWDPVITNTATAAGAINYIGVTLSHPSGSFRTRHVP